MRASDPLAAPVTYGYARALRRYARDLDVDVLAPHEFLAPEDMDDQGYGPDLTRVRSRVVRLALASPREYTAIWWWDTDIIVRDPLVAARMLMTGHDIIGATYPRKVIRWHNAAAWAAEETAAGRPITAAGLEAAAVDFPILPGKGDVGPDQCAPVQGMGLGYMITSTKALRAMVEHYAKDLTFGDVFQGQRHRTVGIFQLATPLERDATPDDPLLSEDYSFCWRAQQCGISVHCYCGPGTPLDHAGAYVFRGNSC